MQGNDYIIILHWTHNVLLLKIYLMTMLITLWSSHNCITDVLYEMENGLTFH